MANDLQSTIALVPAYPWISTEAPAIVDVKAKDGKLSWIAPAEEGKVTDVVRYVVYRFADKKSVNLEDASAIVVVTPNTTFEANEKGVYVVTALNRANNESPASKPVEIK